MLIPLDVAGQVGEGAGVLAFLTVLIREVLSYLGRRRERKEIEQATVAANRSSGNTGKFSTGNGNNKRNGPSSTTNMMLNLIRENHEDLEELSNRLRAVEIAFASMQATCNARHEK